jgi:hypothetical protein
MQNGTRDPTTPTEVVNLLAKGESLAKRALFIVVDSLHNISDRFGEEQMLRILTQLGGLAHRNFTIVCCTSTLEFFLSSPRFMSCIFFSYVICCLLSLSSYHMKKPAGDKP